MTRHPTLRTAFLLQTRINYRNPSDSCFCPTASARCCVTTLCSCKIIIRKKVMTGRSWHRHRCVNEHSTHGLFLSFKDWIAETLTTNIPTGGLLKNAIVVGVVRTVYKHTRFMNRSQPCRRTESGIRIILLIVFIFWQASWVVYVPARMSTPSIKVRDIRLDVNRLLIMRGFELHGSWQRTAATHALIQSIIIMISQSSNTAITFAIKNLSFTPISWMA